MSDPLYLVMLLPNGTELVLLENGCWATVDDLPKLHTPGSVPRKCSAEYVAVYMADPMDGDA